MPALLKNSGNSQPGPFNIDKFKDFNTKYGETQIDVRLLPRFMAALEAHVYSRGFAYRFGGDEYVVLLPQGAPF